MKELGKEFLQSFAKLQADLPVLKKSQSNPHFKSKYAGLVDVMEALHPLLAKHGFVLLQPVRNGEDNKISVDTTLIHVESMQSLSATLSYSPEKNNAQGVGSLITYMRRYSLMSLVGMVADDDDDDGNKASQAPKREETYLESRTQKNDLVQAFKKIGIEDIELMKEYSKASIDKPMKEVLEGVKNYA